LTSRQLHEVVIILWPDQLERRGEFPTAFPITGGELERRGEFPTAFPITGGNLTIPARLSGVYPPTSRRAG
jgi:hypothetical protein